MIIRKETEFGDAVVALLELHLERMQELSPPGSVHALDLAALQTPDLTFWTLWTDGNQESENASGVAREELMGCGALKEHDSTFGEIKSMRTADAFLRQGVAATMLQHIIDTAQSRGYKRLSLETGSASLSGFAAAHALYTRFGFSECEPFAGYVLDPYSLFMTIEL